MKLRPFELGLIVIFLLLMVGALALLKTYRSSDDAVVTIGQLDIWGTLPREGMESILQEARDVNEGYNKVRYTAFDPAMFENELVNALADGRGPDVIILPSEELVALRSKIRPISYESVPRRDIESRYLDGAQIFALEDGLYAYPLLVDPLVLFWNKDILATQNFVAPPKTWESLVNDYVPLLTVRSADRTIEKSAIAMGEYDNVTNAYDIVSMLLQQAGTAGVTEDGSDRYNIRLNSARDQSAKPLQVAIDFYTRFARADNTLYSWNRSFTNDKDRFVSGDVALYLGRASEATDLERRNPNLSFDIAEVPQGAAATVRRTHGAFYGLAVLKTSDNIPGSAVVMRELSSDAVAPKIAQSYGMVPAIRSVVGAGSNDRYGRIAYASAVVAYDWLSPGRNATDGVFSTGFREVIENRTDVSNAATDTMSRLEMEYNQ